MTEAVASSHLFGRLTPSGTFGVCILFILLIASLVPQWIAPYDPQKRFVPYMDPDMVHVLGTDDMGHDIFTLLVYGARISLLIGCCAGGLSILIGTGVGVLSGYFRGRVDDLLMALTDIILIIPKIPAIILIAAFLRPGLWVLILVLGLFSWESCARIVRAKTLQIRMAGFILSAESLGFPHRTIIIREILPVIYPVILPKGMLIIASAMISEASLSFLGLSDPTLMSWGRMIADAFGHGGFIREMWWWFLPPALCISAVIMAVVLIGMGFEEPQSEFIVE